MLQIKESLLYGCSLIYLVIDVASIKMNRVGWCVAQENQQEKLHVTMWAYCHDRKTLMFAMHTEVHEYSF